MPGLRTLMFQPPTCDLRKLAGKPIRIQGKHQHEINAYYRTVKGAIGVVLYSHGTAEDLHHAQRFTRQISKRLKLSVLAYEYCGYGCDASSEPSEACCYSSAECALRWLTKKGWPLNKIVIWGRSLGSGPSCYLAERNDVGALILESAFLSVYELSKDYAGFLEPLLVMLTPVIAPILPIEAFPNADRAKRICCPALVMHGRQDLIIPVRHGLTLAKLLHAFRWFPAGGHDNLDRSRGYWKVVRDWLDLQKL